jgi:heat-inducible transcriptional repressor
MLNERRKKILSALVREYVRSAHPVGSKSLADNYDLQCSSATVRNDLAALEESGYAFQPHVSAGRVPTDAGYRAYVDELQAAFGGAEAAGREIETVRSRLRQVESEIADLMNESAMLLTRLTNYAAIVLTPTLKRSRVRRVDLVPLSDERVLIVLITDSGQVAKRVAEFADGVAAGELLAVEQALNRALDGRLAEELREATADLSGSTGRPDVWLTVVEELFALLTDVDEGSVFSGGTAALLDEPEFEDPEMVRAIVGLLEDGLLLAQTLSDAGRAGRLDVRIGHENTLEELEQMSLVLAPYGDAGTTGYLGLVGPTRMDYLRAIRSVRCVADSLTDAFAPHED